MMLILICFHSHRSPEHSLILPFSALQQRGPQTVVPSIAALLVHMHTSALATGDPVDTVSMLSCNDPHPLPSNK